VVNSWNNLPEGVVSAPSVNSFKSRLDRFMGDYQYLPELPVCVTIPRQEVLQLDDENDDNPDGL
jgi:hypothetical protein